MYGILRQMYDGSVCKLFAKPFTKIYGATTGPGWRIYLEAAGRMQANEKAITLRP